MWHSEQEKGKKNGANRWKFYTQPSAIGSRGSLLVVCSVESQHFNNSHPSFALCLGRLLFLDDGDAYGIGMNPHHRHRHILRGRNRNKTSTFAVLSSPFFACKCCTHFFVRFPPPLSFAQLPSTYLFCTFSTTIKVRIRAHAPCATVFVKLPLFFFF